MRRVNFPKETLAEEKRNLSGGGEQGKEKAKDEDSGTSKARQEKKHNNKQHGVKWTSKIARKSGIFREEKPEKSQYTQLHAQQTMTILAMHCTKLAWSNCRCWMRSSTVLYWVYDWGFVEYVLQK